MSTCQALSQCVNALGRHDRRCPAAPVTAVDVDALDKLRSAATGLPWHQVDTPGCRIVVDDRSQARCIAIEVTDADLIVAAVNALPDLIAEASKYRALREAVLAEAEGMDQELADRGILLDRVIPPGDRLRAVLAAVDGGEQ